MMIFPNQSCCPAPFCAAQTPMPTPHPTPHTPRKNKLLAALPAAQYERLLPHLEAVQMPLGSVVYESGGQLQHLFFPTDCIVSLLYVMENGASAEIAVAGNEGLVGIALFMGGADHPEPRRGAKRRACLSPWRRDRQEGVR